MTPFYAAKLNKKIASLNFINDLHLKVMSVRDFTNLKKTSILGSILGENNNLYNFDFVDSPENTHNNFIKLDFSELIDILKYDIESAKRDFLNFPTLLRVNNIYGEEYGSSTVYYYVKAATPSDAVDMLDFNGFEVYGRKIYSSHDCTGLPFSSGVYMKHVTWSKSLKCYVIPVRWNLDI